MDALDHSRGNCRFSKVNEMVRPPEVNSASLFWLAKEFRGVRGDENLRLTLRRYARSVFLRSA